MKLYTIVVVAFVLAACSSNPTPQQDLEVQSQFVNGYTYVDKDAGNSIFYTGNGTSWQSAFRTLQDALRCARSGNCPNTILVASGKYYPDEGLGIPANNLAASFVLTEGIKLYGGFDGVGPNGIGGRQERSISERDYRIYRSILSGDITQNDLDPDSDGIITRTSDITGRNSYHVIQVAANPRRITSATVLDSFWITAGDTSDSNSSGGGLLCNGTTNACSPTLANLVFQGNRSGMNGGAIANFNSTSSYDNVSFRGNASNNDTGCGGAIYNYASSLTMSNVVFSNNSARDGGAMCNWSSDTTTSHIKITGGTFTGNSAAWKGGGIHNNKTKITLTDVKFSANNAVVGGGIFNLNNEATLLNVGFYGNSSGGGGAIGNENLNLNGGVVLRMRFTNTVFSGNTSSGNGGAIYNLPITSGGTVDMDILNSTFSRNSAAGQGGSIFTEGPGFSGIFDINITNGIMWGGTHGSGGNEVVVNSGGLAIERTIRPNSSVIAAIDGVFTNLGNNISQDPLFENFDGTDNTLGTLDDNLDIPHESPARDSGVNVPNLPARDFLNRSRIHNGTVDRGAYEYQKE